jgi:hypothetical protein
MEVIPFLAPGYVGVITSLGGGGGAGPGVNNGSPRLDRVEDLELHLIGSPTGGSGTPGQGYAGVMELSLPLDMLLVVVVVLHKRVLMEDQLAVLEVMEFLHQFTGITTHYAGGGGGGSDNRNREEAGGLGGGGSAVFTGTGGQGTYATGSGGGGGSGGNTGW